MPMSQNELTDWRNQLMYADRVWYEAGLIDTAGGSTYRDPHTKPIHRYISDYRGDQSPAFEGAELGPGDRVVVNLSFAMTNAVISILSGRDPEPIVKAKGASLSRPQAQRLARLNKLMVQIAMREGRYKREVDRALQCGMTTPFGIVRHGYTPSVEEYTDGDQVFARFKNERPDFPWIRYYAPWDVRIDPLAYQFDPDQSPRWVAFRDVHTELEIKRNPKLIRRRDWQPTFCPAPYRENQETIRRIDAPDAPKLYESWTIFDAIDRKVFAISPGSEKEVREAEDWPIEWGQLPYSILTLNEQLDTPIGIPFPKLYGHEQAMYNRIWTILNSIISRTRRVIFVSKEALNQDSQEKLFNMESLMEFIEASGSVNEAVREIALGVIDPQLIGLLYQLRESIREVIGISQFDRGQRANVETAAEANQIGAGAAVQKSRLQERVEGFWTNVLTVSHRAIHQIRDDRKIIIPLLGEESSDILQQHEAERGYAEVQIEDLRGDFDIGVRLNSTLPLDTAQQFAKAVAVYNTLGGPAGQIIQQLNAARDIADFGEMDPDRWVISANQATAMAQQQSEDAEGDGGEAQVAQGSMGPLLASLNGGLSG